MPWIQRTIQLPAQPRGFHLITREVLAAVPELASIGVGLLHVFIQHTSASLTINENADPDVPADLESSFSNLAPEDFPYRHTCEGPDDMPAHVKAALLGSSVTIPVANGVLCLAPGRESISANTAATAAGDGWCSRCGAKRSISDS